ncbi:MAG: Lrp/AsnC ligand binding domain-containing protein [Tidjanibacter sp.]|nr:Lrp/AsnC ligand binding domain-containing protein [Tidjanibacter sp.]MBQ2247737.1 Lrp/AsnC ligand binding domain-containing protein [Tidjanibacter sp.]
MSKFSLDRIDRKILQLLVRNARLPFLEIARECGISGAAIHQRVKKLDEQGVILGSNLIVDPRILGYDVCAFVGISIQEPSLEEDTLKALADIPEVVECHFITGKHNLLVKIYCRDNEHFMRTLSDKVRKIPGVVATETLISLSQPFTRQIDVSHLCDE